jgi:aconitase B
LGVAPKSTRTRRPLHRQDWVAPHTKMDESELIKEGHYAAF